MRILATKIPLLAAAAIAVGMAPSVRAEDTIIANVPFAFTVGHIQMPAGEYVVTEEPEGSGLLSINTADGHHLAFTYTIAANEGTPGKPQLVFEKLSGQYFLARVIPMSGEERDIVLSTPKNAGN